MPPLSLYPGKLVAPDGSETHPVRVLTIDGNVSVFAWDDVAMVGQLVASWPAEDITAGDRRTWSAPDGTTIGHGRGCGCGHPLKSWRPSPARSGT